MHRPRSFRARRLALSVALALPPVAHAAAYLPGTAEPDPATGEKPAAPAGAPAGNGIRWQFAPWRSEGSLTVDLRALRLEDGSRTTQGLVFGDMDFASYLWQPWFVQVRAGLGVLAGRDSSGAGAGSNATNNNASLTGRVQVSVFPASRFPFELRADVSDSRTRGDTLGNDYKSTRVSVNQSWRPEVGNDSVTVHLDHSRLSSDATGSDTLTALNAVVTRQLQRHAMEASASWSRNERSDTGERSELSSLNGRHTWTPRGSLLVETMASRNEVRLGTAADRADTTVSQVSTLATWRPLAGEPLYRADAPLLLAGSARWVQSAGGDGQAVRAFNATLGANQDLGAAWRLAASGSAGRFDGSSGSSGSAAANVSLNYTPAPLPLGSWRWGPSAAASLGGAWTSADGKRHLEGLQGTHTLSRDWLLDEQSAIAFSIAQSAAVLVDSGLDETTRSLAHTASLFWQGGGDNGLQGFVGLSASDSRNWATGSGRFQLVNLQWTQRLQVNRFSAVSANVTLQGTRNQSTQVDAFTGERRDDRGGWQRFYTASLGWEHQRAFGVPRLRFSLLGAANSQQLERRAFGDVDATRERVSASLEARFDYTIGRLESRLSARVARVDDRTVAALLARVQRRF